MSVASISGCFFMVSYMRSIPLWILLIYTEALYLPGKPFSRAWQSKNFNLQYYMGYALTIK